MAQPSRRSNIDLEHGLIIDMSENWKSYIASLEPCAAFRPAASAEDLLRLEAAFKVALPPDLRSLLSCSDGVEGIHGSSLVWPCARILKDNTEFRASLSFRELYMPFDPLLFFADAGNGDQFAYTICDGHVRPDIFVWNHEDDSRTWVASRLEQYLEWLLTGKLKV
jgi:hypothetical protein